MVPRGFQQPLLELCSHRHLPLPLSPSALTAPLKKGRGPGLAVKNTWHDLRDPLNFRLVFTCYSDVRHFRILVVEALFFGGPSSRSRLLRTA